MMIPGQWEPRRSSAANAASAIAPTAAAAVGRDTDPPIPRRRETAAWLEVTIVAIALLAVMLLAMWASRYDSPIARRHNASEEVASPVDQIDSR